MFIGDDFHAKSSESQSYLTVSPIFVKNTSIDKSDSFWKIAKDVLYDYILAIQFNEVKCFIHKESPFSSAITGQCGLKRWHQPNILRI